MAKNLPFLGKATCLDLGSTGSFKDELKEINTKTQYNCQKLKRKILQRTREKQLVMYEGTPDRMSTDFLAESVQV